MTREAATISIRGATANNLRGVDLELPRGRLVVVTGLSGSGKSSLAFDTLHREGQRRYLETVSLHAQTLLGKLGRPAVERIDGLSPSLALDQRTVHRSPRSTVGTISGVHGELRALFGRVGQARCLACAAPLAPADASQIARAIDERFAQRPLRLLATIVDGHRGARRKQLAHLARAGLTELRVDGKLVPASPTPTLDPKQAHTVEAVSATLGAPLELGALEAAVDQALDLGHGRLGVLAGADETVHRFSLARACLACGAPTYDVGPRLFSFNSPYGACPTCKGLGVEDRVDAELLVADATRTVREGALRITTPTGYLVYSQVTIDVLDQVCRAHGFSVDIPWAELTDEQRGVILYGSDRIEVPFGKHTLASRLRWSGITARPRQQGHYKGIIPVIEEILRNKRNENALRFVRSAPCRDCQGSRLRREALAVAVGGRDIAQLSALPAVELARWLSQLELEPRLRPAAAGPIGRARRRLELLGHLGLGYLSADRDSRGLSGGEARRLRLASQVSGGLCNLLYVLDEPSVGLHPRDNQRLIEVLWALRDEGNTVVVVEHDEAMIRAADWLVDIGPGAGVEGGEVLFAGPPLALAGDAHPRSVTGAFLSGQRRLARPAARRRGSGRLTVRGADARNLRMIDASFRLGAFNAVTGVGGSGKSTLVGEVLARGLRGQLDPPIEGREHVDKVIEIDQAPIGRTPRSNPATFTKVYDKIRALFASEPAAVARGWDRGRFSFNVKGGRCEACGGAGVQSVPMHYLADVEVACHACRGQRFNRETLAVRHRDHSIADVLALPVRDARPLFADQPAVARTLDALEAVGLGYLPLGQPATTLSGGEAQRVKLAAELGRPAKGHTLYLLDEPTTGLHAADVEQLLATLDDLVDRRGHTVIVIEHNLDVIAHADWIVDLGPEGGALGGEVLAEATPEALASVARSLTGQALAAHQGPRPQAPPPATSDGPLVLRGVTTHNLKQLDVEIPRGRITVVTGPSGSGKSSLVIATLAAEGHRRYAEALSTRARRALGDHRAAEVSAITGLSPVVAIGQQVGGGDSPRSTVGTLSGLLDDLRLLFSRAGEPLCGACGAGCRPDDNGARCQACGDERPWPLRAGDLSFNQRPGACERCEGLGRLQRCAAELLVRQPERSLLGGALEGTKIGAYLGEPEGQHAAILSAVGQAHAIDFGIPWRSLPAEAQRIAMGGTGDHQYDVTWRYQRDKRRGEHSWRTTWEGYAAHVEREHRRRVADGRPPGELAGLLRKHTCPDCEGTRLAPPSRAVRCAGLRFDALCAMSIAAARDSIGQALASDDGPSPSAAHQAARVLLERLHARLSALAGVGLGYLTIDRATASLSSGERQRLRLGARLDAGLVGLTYVLDEPTHGLHPRDIEALWAELVRLRDAGNTIVIVEHDAAMIRRADHAIEIGPGAGEAGGRLLAAGPPAQLIADADSRTGHHLRRATRAAELGQTGGPDGPPIELERASARNLQQLDLAIPTGGLVAVTGVSGSGKSTLVFEVLHASACAGAPVGCAAVTGLERFDAVACLDEGLAGSSASTPLTYLEAFAALRERFAATAAAKLRGLTARHFSCNSKGGRCERCEGRGTLPAEMGFFARVDLPCDECGGRRYGEQVLGCRIGGATIADLLALNASEALAREPIASTPRLRAAVEALDAIGLGHLPLGRPTSTLSGGERRRLRLVRELLRAGQRGANGSRLYLLEEPTVGLHDDDVARLLEVFDSLVARGHTVIVIEHNLDVIRRAGWVIDLGPEAGAAGGRLVCCGPPGRVATCEGSHTGRALAGPQRVTGRG